MPASKNDIEIAAFFTKINERHTSYLTEIPPSADHIVAGDILFFRYRLGSRGTHPASNDERVVIIVRTKRGNGVFPGKSGRLLTCFKLNGGSDTVIDLVMDTLYNKRKASSYYSKIVQSLKALLGTSSFRTYKLTSMNRILMLNKKL
jgi:hypothetical protein